MTHPTSESARIFKIGPTVQKLGIFIFHVCEYQQFYQFLILLAFNITFLGTSRRIRPTGLYGQLSPMRQLVGISFLWGKGHQTLYGSQKSVLGCFRQLWPKVINRFGQNFYPMQVVKIVIKYMYFGNFRSTRSKTVGVQTLTFLDLIFQNSLFLKFEISAI